jgi:hypothetical protein
MAITLMRLKERKGGREGREKKQLGPEDAE